MQEHVLYRYSWQAHFPFPWNTGTEIYQLSKLYLLDNTSFFLSFCSTKALLPKKKWRALHGNQNNGPGQNPSSYHQRLAPSLLRQSIPISRHTRVICVLRSVWQITLRIGTLSYLLTLPLQYWALCERAQDCISMLSCRQAVTPFHLP